jgi:hypothetical protein
MTFRPKHVHLVGSIPLSSTKEVFEHLTTALPDRLLRIPDGEPQNRGNFTLFQYTVFEDYPSILSKPPPTYTPNHEASNFPRPMKLNPIMYDDFALDSYREFSKLREKGGIPPGIRFQVSLPTVFSVIINRILPAYHKEVEPVYEEAMLFALRRIQDHIPARDLAIQWDVALEFAALELVGTGREMPASYPYGLRPRPWFSPLKEGLVERIVKLSEAVDDGVELGFHLCYGDAGHKHFVEPIDSALLVEIANLITEGVKRDLNWFHMPIPKDRMDEEFYAPLRRLKLREETELFLGLVHGGDFEGTRQRIEMAGKVVQEGFGVTTECGMGRMAKDEFESVLEISAAVTAKS